MQQARASGLKAVAVLSLLGSSWACGDDPTSARPVPAAIRLLSPATQSGTPGWPLSDSVVVEVLDAQGDALPGVTVTWTAANGDDKLGRSADLTDINGRVSAEWTLGWNQGEQTLLIAAGNLAPLTVTATATIFHAQGITVGGGFACGVVDDGRAFCWGSNYQGQLGNGTVGEPAYTPAPVQGDLVFSQLTASDVHVCGLTPDGTAYCWGGNESGETGTGSMGPSILLPTPVQTALRFSYISAEGSGTWSNSTCGLTDVGEAWCWGYNGLGKLGDGTTTSSAVPVRVLGDIPFNYIHTGFFHSCARAASNGELWCWGEQEDNPGAFGDRPAGLYTTPVVVQPDFQFLEVSAGRNYTCGRDFNYTVYCWGTNWFGSLGTEPPTSATAEPLPVAGGHSFLMLSAAGFEGTHGQTRDRLIYRWGSPGNDIAQPTPVPITDLRFDQISSGEDPFGRGLASCGPTDGTNVYCVTSDGDVRGVPEPAEP